MITELRYFASHGDGTHNTSIYALTMAFAYGYEEVARGQRGSFGGRAACVSHTFSSPSGWLQPWLSPSTRLPAGASQEALICRSTSQVHYQGPTLAPVRPLTQRLVTLSHPTLTPSQYSAPPATAPSAQGATSQRKGKTLCLGAERALLPSGRIVSGGELLFPAPYPSSIPVQK